MTREELIRQGEYILSLLKERPMLFGTANEPTCPSLLEEEMPILYEWKENLLSFFKEQNLTEEYKDIKNFSFEIAGTSNGISKQQIQKVLAKLKTI